MYCAKDQQFVCQCSPLQFLAIKEGGVSAFPNSLKISRIQSAIPPEICLPKWQGLFLYRAKNLGLLGLLALFFLRTFSNN